MKRFGLVVLVVSMVFVVFGCGKKSGLEGKVVDGKGAPVTNVKIIAKQVQPIKGYEQFEATTGSDGSFSFRKLFPTSEYILFPRYEDWEEAPMRTLKYETNKLVARFNKEGWTTEQKMKVQSGPEGQTIMLASPMVIQPCISTVTGKLVDGRKKPLKDIKIIAKQMKPVVPGYEQFEATTGSDGSFSFRKLCPDSKYRLIPGWKFKTDRTWTVSTKGEQEILQASPSFRFILANGVVSDLRTGLQWAAQDNGRYINWHNASAYCQNYSGGGHTDWRLPTVSELEGLYKAGIRCNSGDIINITACCPWASETIGSGLADFHFDFGAGKRYWSAQMGSGRRRALPVRDGKFNDIHEQAQSLINQPLSYLEILELQKSDLEKVSGSFNVKGWNINEGKNYTLFTHGTNDHYHFGYNFNYGHGYDLGQIKCRHHVHNVIGTPLSVDPCVEVEKFFWLSPSHRS